MRLERLILESGEHRFATDFHPRLTVIGGLDDGSRAALTHEVIAALGGARPGTHLELDVDGRSLAIYRPMRGRHRVVDTDAVTDVTAEFLAPDGTINLFAAAGIDPVLGRSAIRLTEADLRNRSSSDATVAALAAVDQEALWEAAMSLRATTELVDRVSAGTGASVTDAMLLDSVEERHGALVEATKSYERVRLISLVLGYVGVLAGFGQLYADHTAAVAVDPTRTVLPFVAVTIIGLLLSLRFRGKVAAALVAEREALTMVNEGDYSSFHRERVGTLLDDDGERRTFMEAVAAHRTSTARWSALAGDTPLAFALDHQAAIRATSDLHGGMGALQVLSDDVPPVADDVIADLAQTIVARIDAVRAMHPGHSPFPLIVDDPFAELDRSIKPLVLEMLAASAVGVQVIVLTTDPDVTAWARTESLAGTVSVVEPRMDAAVVTDHWAESVSMSPRD